MDCVFVAYSECIKAHAGVNVEAYEREMFIALRSQLQPKEMKGTHGAIAPWLVGVLAKLHGYSAVAYSTLINQSGWERIAPSPAARRIAEVTVFHQSQRLYGGPGIYCGLDLGHAVFSVDVPKGDLFNLFVCLRPIERGRIYEIARV